MKKLITMAALAAIVTCNAAHADDFSNTYEAMVAAIHNDSGFAKNCAAVHSPDVTDEDFKAIVETFRERSEGATLVASMNEVYISEMARCRTGLTK